MPPDEPPDPNAPAPRQRFSQLVAAIEGGTIDDLLTADFSDLVQDCQARDKSGTLTLTISVKPKGRSGSQAQLSISHSVKHPKAPPAEALMYIGDGGTLHRSDPFQLRFPTAPTPAAPAASTTADPASKELP